MTKSMLTRCILAAFTLIMVSLAMSQEALQEIPTAEGDRKLKIVPAGAPGGMAIDAAGNVYVSDQGDGSPGSGFVKLLRPADIFEPITILKELTRPGDIEISSDGHSLLIGQDNASIPVMQSFFGLSVRFTFPDGSFLGNARVFVETDLGTAPPVAISDVYGYYTIPDILAPGQTSSTVTITVQEGNKAPRVFYNVRLSVDPKTGKPCGHSAIKLNIAR